MWQSHLNRLPVALSATSSVGLRSSWEIGCPVIASLTLCRLASQKSDLFRSVDTTDPFRRRRPNPFGGSHTARSSLRSAHCNPMIKATRMLPMLDSFRSAYLMGKIRLISTDILFLSILLFSSQPITLRLCSL